MIDKDQIKSIIYHDYNIRCAVAKVLQIWTSIEPRAKKHIIDAIKNGVNSNKYSHITRMSNIIMLSRIKIGEIFNNDKIN